MGPLFRLLWLLLIYGYNTLRGPGWHNVAFAYNLAIFCANRSTAEETTTIAQRQGDHTLLDREEVHNVREKGYRSIYNADIRSALFYRTSCCF